jgi:hypothetical protein
MLRVHDNLVKKEVLLGGVEILPANEDTQVMHIGNLFLSNDAV